MSAPSWRRFRDHRLAAEIHEIPFHVLDDFLYPGHRHHRMHAVPEVIKQGLVTRLEQAVSATETMIVTSLRHRSCLFRRRRGRRWLVRAPDGASRSHIRKADHLACNGYGKLELVARHIPEMKDAIYFGHPGNQGEAILWGEKLDAVPAHLSGYQGLSVAHPHGILVTWALMMEGGFGSIWRGAGSRTSIRAIPSRPWRCWRSLRRRPSTYSTNAFANLDGSSRISAMPRIAALSLPRRRLKAGGQDRC